MEITFDFTEAASGARPKNLGHYIVCYRASNGMRQQAGACWDGEKFIFNKKPARFVVEATEPSFEPRAMRPILGFCCLSDWKDETALAQIAEHVQCLDDECDSLAFYGAFHGRHC